uniref:G_PROTEIN_RECEP_F1_2 domain-containing protein n=1 Tax=Parastrongyloides trichosuri TaxID=131310 RepID=A0A0N4Z3W8_PARTI
MDNVIEETNTKLEFQYLYVLNIIIGLGTLTLSLLFFCSYCSKTTSRNASLILKIILDCDVATCIGVIARNIHGLVQEEFKHKKLWMISTYSCIFNYHIIWITIFYQLPTLLVFILSLDRYLAVNYSLWFKAVPIARLPLLGYCFITVLLTILVALLNVSYIAPHEKAHFTCPIFEGFGFYYNYGIKAFIITYLCISLILCTLALKKILTKNPDDKFGGFRSRYRFELRMTKRSFFIILYFFFVTIPPILLTLLFDSDKKEWTPIKEAALSLLFLRPIFTCIVIWRIFPTHIKFSMCKKMKSRNAVQQVQIIANYLQQNRQ